ncbi:zymogen granule membrane protein 16-like [Cottoperca gobio]|uniref:Zymogen granule membrane protein 16-like n=1 Tax=Cottoperca gobio TaxID=56716 RepID=A0A6J2RAC9_COTGO|nr:zymogen granule membrane protein 16-like [Cottoperca gobio]
MFSFLFIVALCASCLASPTSHSSFSPAVGSGSGTSFSIEKGNERLTGVRLWEIQGSYITGLQLRYGYIWSNRVGRVVGNPHELILFVGEVIVQVSGKYHNSNYIYQLIFVTSRGRSLIVGQPVQFSFNFYAAHPDTELSLLSGRYNTAGITSIAAHWEHFDNPDNSTTNV